MDFFNNAWVVGIGVTVIGGLILALITRPSRERNRRRNIINKANAEVIDLLKPYIVDEGLPSAGFFKALINSVARKNDIDALEMYDIETFCQELIKVNIPGSGYHRSA